MHLYDVERGNLGANAVVGGGLPAIVGAALAFQLRGEPRVAVAFFGDGATNIGTFHESLNLAQLWKVPAVFVLENNHWAESTPASQQLPLPVDQLGRRAAAFGMKLIEVDGQDVEAVYLARSRRREHARAGKGPVFLHLGRTGSSATTSAIRRSTATRRSSRRCARRRTRSGCSRAARALGRGVRGGRRRGDGGGPRPRSSSRRPAPTRSPRTRSRTSMPELTYREAVRDALAQAMREDDDVFIMGEDIAEMGGSMGVTQGLLDEFGPERVRNTPISEMAIVGAGIGAAMQGMRPIVEIMYEDFLTLSMEQIVNQAAKHRYMSGGQLKVPLTIRTQGGAGWSPGAQHAQQLEAWFVHVPGLKVVFASTPEDVRGLLWSSIYDDNPVVFFEHRTLYPIKDEVPDELEPIPLGQGAHPPRGRGRDRRRDRAARARGARGGGGGREGGHLGRGRRSADAAAARRGDDRRLGAQDDALRRRARGGRRGGFGAEVAAVIQHGAFDWLDAPIERVGAKFAPLPFAPVMEQYVVPHADDVLEAIRRTVARS